MRATIILSAAATLIAASAAAQTQIVLPETAVTANREPTPITDIPAGVTVIDRAQIQASGAVTVGDVLAAVPGLHVSPSGGPGGQSSVFVRGTNSSHVLVMRDGMPVNDASEPSGAFNFGVQTLSDIERIEIVRGPMAALYGSGAIGGVINLISRRGTTDKPLIEMELAGGYPASFVGAASVSGIQGPVDYALTMQGQWRRGFDYTPRRWAAIYTGTPQFFSDRSATLNLGYTPVEGTRLSLFLRGSETAFAFNTLGFPTFDSANSNGSVANLLGRVGVESRLFGGAYQTSAYLGYQQQDRHYWESLNAFDPNLAAQDNRYHSYQTDLQWNNIVHLNDLFPSTVLSRSDLTFGYERTINSINTKINDSFASFPFTSNAQARSIDDALYLGVTTTVLERLILTGQVRQDWISPNQSTTWRLGAVYKVPEIGTSFKAAYGTAFRAPSLFERFGTDSFGTMGNPNLKPETAQGYEIGFTTQAPIPGHPDAVTFGATYFNEQINDLIVNIFGPVTTFQNVASAHIQGVETELTLRPAPWLMAHLSWTYTQAIADGQSPSVGSNLLRRPQNAGEADVIVTPLPGLKLTAQVIVTGAAHDFLYDNTGTGIGFGVGQHGLVANASVSYDVTPNVQLYVNGQNLFGSRYEPVNGFQMPGTAVLAGARMHW